MKIDCSNIVNLFKEKNRLTKDCDIYCSNCRLSSNNNEENYDCGYLLNFHPEKAVEIMQKWSDENPVKTRLDDFREKYPNHKTHVTDGMPCVCCKNLGYTDECPIIECKTCKNCWDMPL